MRRSGRPSGDWASSGLSDFTMEQPASDKRVPDLRPALSAGCGSHVRAVWDARDARNPFRPNGIHTLAGARRPGCTFSTDPPSLRDDG